MNVVKDNSVIKESRITSVFLKKEFKVKQDRPLRPALSIFPSYSNPRNFKF